MEYAMNALKTDKLNLLFDDDNIDIDTIHLKNLLTLRVMQITYLN